MGTSCMRVSRIAIPSVCASRMALPLLRTIAYIALCIENSPKGKGLLEDLRDIAATDPEFIQFGSAEWFWDRQVNSYALQVEPERYMDKDQVTIDYWEALRVQDVRDSFFSELRNLLRRKG